MTELFCKLTHVIMAATHWISVLTGEHINFTGDQKIIWAWMRNRFRFFQSTGREWFDNQADIAAATGTSESTVKRFVKALVDHGYLEVKTRRSRGFIQSNSYIILSDLVFGSRVSEPVSTPAPVPTLDDPEERIPAYAPIVRTAPVSPKVNLPSGPVPVVLEVLEVPKIKLTNGIPAGNEPVWEVFSSN